MALKKKVTLDEYDRAKKAIENFRRMKPTLTSFARAYTGKDIRIEVIEGAEYAGTDGKVIYMMPPLSLGDQVDHDLANCDTRDDRGYQVCVACRTREGVMSSLYHEIAHIAFNSFEASSNREIQKLIDTTVADLGVVPRMGERIKKRWYAVHPRQRSQIKGLLALLHPYLPVIYNSLEDARVNYRQAQARPGVGAMTEATSRRVMEEGVEGFDAETRKPKQVLWVDQPLNAQACVAVLLRASGMSFPGTLAPEVEHAVLTDEVIGDACREAQLADSTKTVYALSVVVLVRLWELGFCKTESEQEQDEEEDSQESAESEEESESSGDEPQEEGDDSESGDAGESNEGGETEGGNESGSAEGESDEAEGSDAAGEGGASAGDEDEATPSSESEAEGDTSEGAESEADEAGDGGDESSESDDSEGTSDNEASDPSAAADGADAGGAATDASTLEDGASGAQGGADGADSATDASEPSDEEGEPDEADLEGQQSEMASNEVVAPKRELGSADEALAAVEALTGHGADDGSPGWGGVGESGRDKEVMEHVVKQLERFDSFSQVVAQVRVSKSIDDGSFWTGREQRHPEKMHPESRDLQPALNQMRRTFDANKRSKNRGGLRAGKVDARVLGRRAWNDDDRLFKKKSTPAKRSYFVVIGMDFSGSTNDGSLAVEKRAVYAQCELLNRMGIPFALYGHSADMAVGVKDHLDVVIAEIKAPRGPWDAEAKRRLGALDSYGGNLDGHTLEFYRKVLDSRTETDKVLLYYTDGAMPASNYDEELDILKREIKTCNRSGYVLLGCGIGTDSPAKHGLDTVQIDTVADIEKAVRHLETRMEGR